MDVRHLGSRYNVLSAERRPGRVGLSAMAETVSARYAGHIPWWTGCIMVHSLCWMRWCTGSLCSWRRARVTWSRARSPNVRLEMYTPSQIPMKGITPNHGHMHLRSQMCLLTFSVKRSKIILYPTARLYCVCLLRFTMLYFIACCSFSVIFSLRATMLINLNLNPRSQQAVTRKAGWIQYLCNYWS